MAGQRQSSSELNVGPISNSTEKVQAINDARFDEILKRLRGCEGLVEQEPVSYTHLTLPTIYSV